MSLESSTATVQKRVGDDSGLGKTLRFDFEDEGAIFLDGASTPNVVNNNTDGDADCTIKMTLENFQNMLDGELNPMMAFMSGKIKVEGDMGVAMKLQSVLDGDD